jgi:hypothetical protein
VNGLITTRVVKKAWELSRSIHRDYMVFTKNMECLRVVIHPQTHLDIQREFWEEMRQRGTDVHQGYCVQEVTVSRDGTDIDDRMLGIKVATDDMVPEGEVELRAVLARSWEAV